jgi:hypothetical protein
VAVRVGLDEFGGKKICPGPGFELRSVSTSVVGIFKYMRDLYDRGNLKIIGINFKEI